LPAGNYSIYVGEQGGGFIVSSKLRPYLRSIYQTLVIWICEAFGLLLLIHFILGLNVNSVYDPTNDEVAAFEELIGSHGGLGGTQV
jgi:hypothetical protein